MRETMRRLGGDWNATRGGLLIFAALLVAGAVMTAARSGENADQAFDSAAKLGEALFFDVNLSKNRTQACATCHAPDMAFTDPREAGGAGRAASLGDDGQSIGDRNTPSAAYAALAPNYHVDAKGDAVGGLFWDGRAATLDAQAEGPPLNPIEMGMPDKASIAARLKENPRYVASFAALYGKNVLNDAGTAFSAMAASIGAFERTEFFAPFDSKYDRFLRGEVQLTDQEELGRVIFFSTQFANCSRCHKLKEFGGAEREPFTNFKYRNIGVPANKQVRAVNGKDALFVDGGLMQNPVASASQNAGQNAGKFRVPGLRNVAVTGPYMHNGVFRDLRTVIKFYNKYNSKNPKHQINPETGEAWGPPEVPDNIANEDLTTGSALDSKRVDAILAFLKTLTDKRYEPLLNAQAQK